MLESLLSASFPVNNFTLTSKLTFHSDGNPCYYRLAEKRTASRGRALKSWYLAVFTVP